ncbi:MAG: ABC transporter ATP-binding protein [Peptococcaceae bacterium]|jgi:peptide/nickel transport system ATP-binding protein|nr:ABC transporter ATP-binding protein [Peptococcaceae bacterium]
MAGQKDYRPIPDDYLLTVSGLSVGFQNGSRFSVAVDDLSIGLAADEILCLVGESGCGKSATALAVTRLLGKNGRVISGEVLFEGQNLTSMTEKELSGIRGRQIGVIFQNPSSSLNPVLPIGEQVSEALRIHYRLPRREAGAAAAELLRQVGIPSPAAARQYPHGFSGGMRQRAMIAMALACGPKLLIADEPTTALDVTLQASILRIFQTIRQSQHTAILFITHDLGVVAEIADRVLVMYAGELVEQADAFSLFARPSHPYTQMLLACAPGRAYEAELSEGPPYEASMREALSYEAPPREALPREALPREALPSATPPCEGPSREAPTLALADTAPASYDRLPGCRFFSRCPRRRAACQTTHPGWTELARGHLTRCPYSGEGSRGSDDDESGDESGRSGEGGRSGGDESGGEGDRSGRYDSGGDESGREKEGGAS